jgi:hypothetical protein
MPSARLAEKQGFSMDPQNSSPFFFRCRVGASRPIDEAEGHDGKGGLQAGRVDGVRKELFDEGSVLPAVASGGQVRKGEELQAGER